jgi:hypothetical protein
VATSGDATTKGRIADARGRTVTQLDPVSLHVWHRYDVIPADALDEIVETLEPGTARLRRLTIAIVPACIMLVAVWIAALYYFSDPSARQDLVSTLTNPVIFGPSIICCFVVPCITARQARRKRVRFAMLKCRRCPHCGYDLRRLPVDPTDEATVCPECGCAWRLDHPEIDHGLMAGTAREDRRRTTAVLVGVALLLVLAAGFGVLLLLRWA